MRIEWAVMKVAYKIGSGWLARHSKFFRMMFAKMISLFGDGEVYTIDECYKILDILYRHHPHVYVGMRICCCRQAMEYYDKDISNITDLTFIFSKTPGVKKHFDFTKFISLEEAKRLLKKFDDEGFVHTMFGACARYIDGSINLSICNCSRRRNNKGNGCIPMTLKEEYNTFIYHKPHNIAIIDQNKCIGVYDCGKCIEYCNFDARVIDINNGKIKILNNKCQGCGLCLTHCPEGANSIKFLPENKIYFYRRLFKNIIRQHKRLPEKEHPRRYAHQYPYSGE
ncbi:MAG: ATP-binding protein [Promethearchaeota archaeon]